MKRISLSLLMLWLMAALAAGQVPYFKNYFLLQKNDPVRVNAIFQDKSGYIWFGTDKGLFRNDGIRQKRLTTADSLPDDNVTALAQDSSGKIWIGFRNGDLASLENGIAKKFGAAAGKSSKEISDILFDRSGHMWFSTLGDGLFQYSENQVRHINEKNGFPDSYVYDLAEDNNGNLWCGTDGGAAICSFSGNAIHIKVLDYDNGLPDNIIRKIGIQPDGKVWLATEAAGIVSYNLITGKCKSLISGSWDFGAVTDFIFHDDEAWVSCHQNGLLAIDLGTGSISTYDPSVQPGLATVNCIFADAEGNIWIGNSTGIIRTPGNFIEYLEQPTPAQDASVMAIAADNSGTIWFSTRDGLFTRSQNSSGEEATEKQLVNTPYENKTVISLYVDDEDYVWAGFFGEGVIRIQPHSGRIRYLQTELTDGNILNISGKGNSIWLATLGGATEITKNGESLSLKHYSSADGLVSDYIYQCFIDSRNRVWFGTDGKGVVMKDSLGFHHFEDSLQSKVVFGFAEDNQHRIWANVQGEGIWQFDGKCFIAPSAEGVLRDNNVQCLSSDKSGYIVAMHDLGIDVFQPKSNSFRFLGEPFGLHDKIAGLNAVAKDKYGRLLIGTDKGIIVYAGKPTLGTDQPKPFIEGLKILGNPVEISSGLTLSYDQNDITLNVLGFWYQNPENITFRYKLENFDRDWITSRNNSVTYSSLPPGKYTFRLRASDPGFSGDVTEATCSLTILPPFWKTTWFYLLSIASGILLVWAFILYREKKLQEDKKILEAKNSELKKINMELDKFVYSVSHDLRAPLLSMQGVVEITADESEEEFTRSNLSLLKESIKKLDGFIKDILDYSRNSRTEIQKQEIDFKELMKEITSGLKYMGNPAKPVDIRVKVNREGTFRSDKNRISILLNNLISNAIRYHNPGASDPFVGLEIDMSDTETNIIVKDNGIGIDKKNHDKIFEMFYRVSENSVGSGLGLYLVKEIVDKLNGEITVDSEPGVGSSFTISIPNQS